MDFQETLQCLSDFLMKMPGGTTNNALSGRQKTTEHLMCSWYPGWWSQTSCRTLGKLLNESRCLLDAPSLSFLPFEGEKKRQGCCLRVFKASFD